MTQKPKNITEIKQFDIPVTISVSATTEREAEEKVMLHLKSAQIITGNPDVIDWELIEFVPSELKSCCC